MHIIQNFLIKQFIIILTEGDVENQSLLRNCDVFHPAVRDAKSEEHEERAPAIFPPAVLIFGLPMQKIC